jgi:methionine-S-sulfoxide reductase
MRTTLAAFVGFLIGPIALPPLCAGEPAPLGIARRTGASRDNAAANIGGANIGIADRAERASATSGIQPVSRDPPKTKTAVFAGGCFWCTELAFEQLRGVADVESGYCGGTRPTANYDRVHRGTTAHAEAIRVTYDPTKISYDQLLDVFFDAHDPTQFNRQGEDEGRQYRSAIFFADDEQKKEAEAKVEELRRKRVYARHIVTRVEPLATFYPAEDVHQDFARKYPLLPYIQDHAIPKACNVRIKHPELIGPGQ